MGIQVDVGSAAGQMGANLRAVDRGTGSDARSLKKEMSQCRHIIWLGSLPITLHSVSKKM